MDLMPPDVVDPSPDSAEDNAEKPESENNCVFGYERPLSSDVYGEFIPLNSRRCGMEVNAWTGNPFLLKILVGQKRR